jgi:predicted peptidase
MYKLHRLLKTPAFFLFITALWFRVSGQISTSDMAVAQNFILKNHIHRTTNLEYRFFIPRHLQQQKKYPLVLTLHGAGDNDDSWAPITKHPIAVVWARDSIQAKDPCFVVSPRITGRWVDTDWSKGSYSLDGTPVTAAMAAVIDLLDTLQRTYPIDTTRIYVSGLSMGGFGTWDIAMRCPGRFAAIAPMCGGADPSKAHLLAVPVWTTHGTADGIIPVSSTRQIVSALAFAGRNVLYTDCIPGDQCKTMSINELAGELAKSPSVVYSEYLNVDHVGAWRNNKRGYDNPLLVPWILSHRKDSETSVSTHQVSRHLQLRPAYAKVLIIGRQSQVNSSREIVFLNGSRISAKNPPAKQMIIVPELTSFMLKQ